MRRKRTTTRRRRARTGTRRRITKWRRKRWCKKESEEKEEDDEAAEEEDENNNNNNYNNNNSSCNNNNKMKNMRKRRPQFDNVLNLYFIRAQDFIHTSHVAMMVTTLPTYPLLGIGVSLVLETINQCSYWTQVMRVFCLGVVATWDLNAAFILHSGTPFPGKLNLFYNGLNICRHIFICI